MNEKFERFQAPTMPEALEKIREKFGHEAMIMGSRKFRTGGFFGFGGRKMVEVYAVDASFQVPNLKTGRVIPSSPVSTGEPGQEIDGAPFTPPPIREKEQLEKIKADIGSVKDIGIELLNRQENGNAIDHPFLRECYKMLVDCEIEPQVAHAIVSEIEEQKLPAGFPAKANVELIVRDRITSLFPANSPMGSGDGPRIIFLIGPTGVGKTTTIAKLASRAKVNQRRKVGLITLDTFRIGAVDQLKQYGEIFSLPVHVVEEPDELASEVEKCAGAGDEIIYIDSAGRSPQDEPKMSELKGFINALPEAEIHLVLSTTTHPKTIESIADRFKPMLFDQVILTKLDESVSLGPLVGCLLRIGKPISYLTDGQNVPKDIFPADPERLGDFIMNKQKA